MKYRIVTKTNADDGFYRLLGPFLARREIEKEIGHPIYDDDDKFWCVAMAGGEVAGFCSWREHPKGVRHIGNGYVLPEHRRRGVYRMLFAAACNGAPREIRATTRNAALARMHVRDGFKALSSRGAFTQYAKEVGDV